ncbi:P2X purinoceptor 7-like [Littorina saxatilis]
MSTNWCQCANCAGMGSIRECRCCQEIPEMESLTVSTGVGCITDHPGFRSVCLDHYVLETCYHWYNQQYGRAIQDANERFRYVAYRMLVRWVWKWLGRDIRVTLPACAVARIREQFPSADGQYVGYRDPE